LGGSHGEGICHEGIAVGSQQRPVEAVVASEGDGGYVWDCPNT
jgi:hypothetical protein